VWAPLPPEQTGIADYTVELLAGLTRGADVEVFVNEGFLPDVDLMARYRVHEHHAFERRLAQVGFDAVIYQVGGSFFHWYMNEAMEKHPGIVVLHELSWSHLLYAHSELHGDVGRFRDQLAEMEGDLALRTFDAIQEEGPPSLRQEFLDTYPMLGRIVDASPALIVHYDGARREIEQRYPDATVRTVVMGVADPYTGPAWRDWALARRSLGLATGAYVIGVFGIVHHSKRVEAVLEALPAVLREIPAAVVLLVGRAHDPRYLSTLVDLARRLGVEGSVRFLGEVDRRTFDGALVACDVVVNLRESTVTHLSATLMRAMAAGRPVVTSEAAGWDFIPDDACVRIASDGALAGELCRLGGDPTLRVRMGEAARRYFEEEATVDVMARHYLEVVDAVTAKASR
jgi:glycosyltransferase involved in cell wall biosynthesis